MEDEEDLNSDSRGRRSLRESSWLSAGKDSMLFEFSRQDRQQLSVPDTIVLDEENMKSSFRLMRGGDECISHENLACFLRQEKIAASPEEVEQMLDLCSPRTPGRVDLDSFLSMLRGIQPAPDHSIELKALASEVSPKKPMLKILITQEASRLIYHQALPALNLEHSLHLKQTEDCSRTPGKTNSVLKLRHLRQSCRRFYQSHLTVDSLAVLMKLLYDLNRERVSADQLTRLIRRNLSLKQQDLRKLLAEFSSEQGLVKVRELALSLVGVACLNAASKVCLVLNLYPPKITFADLSEIVDGLVFSQDRSFQSRLKLILRRLNLPALLTHQQAASIFQEFNFIAIDYSSEPNY